MAYTKEEQAAYRKTLKHSTYAFKKELAPGFDKFMQLTGARSVSWLMGAFAEHPERAAELLKTFVAEIRTAEDAEAARKASTLPGAATARKLANAANLANIETEDLDAVIARLTREREMRALAAAGGEEGKAQ